MKTEYDSMLESAGWTKREETYESIGGKESVCDRWIDPLTKRVYPPGAAWELQFARDRRGVEGSSTVVKVLDGNHQDELVGGVTGAVESFLTKALTQIELISTDLRKKLQ